MFVVADSERFKLLVQDTYGIAHSCSEQMFKQRILERLTQTVQLDTAFWMTRSEVDTPYAAEETYTYNLPEGVQENYIKHPTVFQQALELNQVLMANLGTTIDVKDIIPQQQWLKSDMYLLHCKKYDIEHSLMTLYASDHNQMIDSVSLNRHARRQPFSQQEREFIQAYVPHMVEAQRLNTLQHFQRNQAIDMLRGVIDKHGKVIEADSGFVEMLADINVDLSTVDSEKVQLNDPESGYTCHGYRQSGNIYLEVQQKSPWEELSPRKADVAQLLIQGKPNKAIASQLDMSVETVNEYVGDIFKRLRVCSRYQAIAALSGGNRNITSAQLLLSSDNTQLYRDSSAAAMLDKQCVQLDDVIQRANRNIPIFAINGILFQCDKTEKFSRITSVDYSEKLTLLTERELVIAYLIGNLLSNNEIAEQLEISVKTVENQLTSIYRKLQLRNRSELVARLNASSDYSGSHALRGR